MKKYAARADGRKSLSRHMKRNSLFVSFMVLSMMSWMFAAAPSVVLADDKNPASVSEDTLPSFPLVSEEYNTNTAAVYEVPLALNPHDHFYFYRPIAMDTNSMLNSDFRYGYYYEDGIKAHSGIDIGSPLHKPVLAAGDGEVVFTGYGLMNGGGDESDPYGIAVLIRHNFTYNGKSIYTVYAHLDGVTVEPGQQVETGQQIGILGLTGNTSGPHVHFEVRIEDSEVGYVQNPELWLSPTVGSGVLAGLAKDDWGYFITAEKIYLKSYDTDEKYEFLTYASEKNICPDDYFKENFAIGDLPAGKYEISMIYKYKWYRTDIYIAPATINYVYFSGKNGFIQQYPSSPKTEDFLN